MSILPASNDEDSNTVEEVEEISTDVLEDQDIIDSLLSSKESSVQTESPEVVAEKEKTINDIADLLPGLDLESGEEDQELNEEVSITDESAQEDTESTESSIVDEIE